MLRFGVNMHKNLGTTKAKIVGVLCVLLALGSVGSAEASDWMTWVPAAEVFIPDVHMEFGGGIDGARTVLAWPIPITWLLIKWRGTLDPENPGEKTDDRILFFQSLVELHSIPSKNVGRLLLGGRVGYSSSRAFGGFGGYAEGGYIIGQDFDAPLVGTGVGYGLEGSINIWVGYRLNFSEEIIHDVTLNLEFSVPIFLLF